MRILITCNVLIFFINSKIFALAKAQRLAQTHLSRLFGARSATAARFSGRSVGMARLPGGCRKTEAKFSEGGGDVGGHPVLRRPAARRGKFMLEK